VLANLLVTQRFSHALPFQLWRKPSHLERKRGFPEALSECLGMTASFCLIAAHMTPLAKRRGNLPAQTEPTRAPAGVLQEG
jgi:hypothetical protein